MVVAVAAGKWVVARQCCAIGVGARNVVGDGLGRTARGDHLSS